MALILDVEPALRRMFEDDAYRGFVNIINQVETNLRNGYQHSLDLHFHAFKEYLDRRLSESEAKTEKRFAEIKVEIERRFSEMRSENEKRFSEIRSEIDKRFSEMRSEIDKRFGEIRSEIDKRFGEIDKRFGEIDKRFTELQSSLEVKIAQSQATLLRWMFTFFIGTVVTLATLFFTYLQLVLKP
jgi:DNA anti-recombination protein RmuC